MGICSTYMYTYSKNSWFVFFLLLHISSSTELKIYFHSTYPKQNIQNLPDKIICHALICDSHRYMSKKSDFWCHMIYPYNTGKSKMPTHTP